MIVDGRTRRKRRWSVRRKGDHSFRPTCLVLEDRIVLSAIIWNTTTAPTGGDWDTESNWVGGVIPNASNSVTINLTSSGTVTHSTGANDAALSLTTNGNTTLSIGSGSISLGDASSSIGSVTIGSRGDPERRRRSKRVDSGGGTITDNGAMDITGASFGFVAGFWRRPKSWSTAP